MDSNFMEVGDATWGSVSRTMRCNGEIYEVGCMRGASTKLF